MYLATNETMVDVDSFELIVVSYNKILGYWKNSSTTDAYVIGKYQSNDIAKSVFKTICQSYQSNSLKLIYIDYND